MTINPGDVICLGQGASDTAAFYDIDLVDLENVPAAFTAPSNSVSITAYGADNTGVTDSTTALESAISYANGHGDSVWTNVFSGITVAQGCELNRCGGFDPSFNAWRGAFQICLQLTSISNISVNNMNITNSVSGFSIISPGSGVTLSNAVMGNVSIANYGLGVSGQAGYRYHVEVATNLSPHILDNGGRKRDPRHYQHGIIHGHQSAWESAALLPRRVAVDRSALCEPGRAGESLELGRLTACPGNYPTSKAGLSSRKSLTEWCTQ